jgi:tetratricopeptide (TPR) repeat protein
MKLITTTALLFAGAAPSTMVLAQGYGGSGPQPSQTYNNPGTDAQADQPRKQQPAGSQIKPSPKALKALIDLQTAVKANDTANIPAKVAAAQAVASTPQDRYLIAQLQLQAAAHANDTAGAAAAADAMAASGIGDRAQLAKLYGSIGGSFYNAKQYDRAAAAYTRAIELNPGDTDSQEMLGESHFAAGQKAEAAAAFQRAIQMTTAAGKKPDEGLLKSAVKVAYDQQSPSAVELARQWVAAYPSPASWSDAIAIYRNLNHPDVEGTMDLYRLMALTGSLTGPQYAQYSRAAAAEGNFNEAQAAYDAGVAAKLINPAGSEYSDLTSGLKGKPKATAADLAAATKTAVNGTALLRIGDRYYAMGDYAKAVELYKMSMGKPGVDTSVANLHIGMALTRAGDKAGATAALNSVTGPRADIAKFWLTYLNQKA